MRVKVLTPSHWPDVETLFESREPALDAGMFLSQGRRALYDERSHCQAALQSPVMSGKAQGLLAYG